MTIIDDRRSNRYALDAEQAFEQLAKIVSNVNKDLLRYALNTRKMTKIRTLSRHRVQYDGVGDPRALLFYESGWTRKDSGGREYMRLFLLPDGSWLVQKYSGTSRVSQEPTVSRCDTADLLPVLEKAGFRGYTAISSIRRLLNIVKPRATWSESWSTLKSQIDKAY